MHNNSPPAIPAGPARLLARNWLILGIAALLCSGLLAVLLVLARTPGIQDFVPLREFFHSALVIHVDLSVLIWFLAFAGMLWSLIADEQLMFAAKTGFVLAAAGTATLAVSPFFPEAQPLMNNYVPVLRQPLFFVGLALVGAGFGLTALRALIFARLSGNALAFGIWLSAVAGIISLIAFLASWLLAPQELTGQHYYEVVFWGGGHALQFQHTLLLGVSWLWLAHALDGPSLLSSRVWHVFFGLAALPLLLVPLSYFLYLPHSVEHMKAMAKLMEQGHMTMLPMIAGIAILLPGLARVSSPAKSALFASFGLFAIGGILAFMIRGVNVVIPAHYHGSIVGVTLSFMGLAYVLLPRFGFGTVEGKMARWQPYVYGSGQLLHILGLAWSGGYGVQRKVAGAEQALSTLPQKLGMGLMGLGGLIAIIGGVMFVVVCLTAMARRSPASPSTPETKAGTSTPETKAGTSE
ncbi:MAG: cbb3-type cytochrome c oxidase subunit I [Betaproteobacteria bacterium]|nr:cbb3-type cytochrome c oxidase subunit I [Betaproteobacteria bacterium]